MWYNNSIGKLFFGGYTMGKIKEYLAREKRIELELEEEGIRLQDELQVVVPSILSQWAKTELWIWGEITSDGSSMRSYYPCMYGHNGLADTTEKVEQQFKELAVSWQHLVKVAVAKDGDGLCIVFEAL